jgi:hypothetical protein
MSKRVTWALAACSALILAGSLALAGSASAATLPLPQCSSTDPGPGSPTNLVGATNQSGQPPHCWYVQAASTEGPVASGTAGYLGANDNHTHYRYVTTDIKNVPELVNLDGGGNTGAGGVFLCDPNDHAYGAGGWVAETGLLGNTGITGQENTVYYAAGFWKAGAPDPCVTHGLLIPDPNTTLCPPGGKGSVFGIGPAAFCGSFSDPSVPNGYIGSNDLLGNLAIYYSWGPGSHHHDISFGYLDVTTGIPQQAYTHKPVDVNLWEFGVGVLNTNQMLTGGAINTLLAFNNDMITCYSCAHPVGIETIQPVNPFNVGGLEEVQSANKSGQVTLGPNNSLSGDNFTVFNGSTSP